MKKELIEILREFRKDYPMTEPEHLTLELLMEWLEYRTEDSPA